MMDFSDGVYHFAFRRLPPHHAFALKFAHEIADDEECLWSNMGIFVFLRHEKNRGKARKLDFPCIVGFSEQAMEISVTLRSLYPEIRNANKFVCEPNDGAPFVAGLTFTARPLPAGSRLEGSAASLSGHRLWELVPDNRFELERHWRERKFYFLGLGKAPDQEG